MKDSARSSTSRLADLPPFIRRVLRAANRIPRGRVATYADVARAVGRPRAGRAVGRALGANPRPVAIPCHRVVRSDGRIGGYRGGARRKRFLLQSEGVVIVRGAVDLARFGVRW